MAIHPARSTSSEVTVTSANSKMHLIFEQVGLFVAIVGPFCLTIYAAITLTHGMVPWPYLLATLIMFTFAGLGVTAGYHRMLTHQSFKAHPVVQYILLIAGAMAGMASPILWAHKHMHHHMESDKEDDIHSPHTPRFKKWPCRWIFQWFDSHMGWLFRHQPVRVSKKALQVTNTPAARFVDKTCHLWLLAGILGPLCFGWTAFVWVGCVRLFMNHHVTWSVNSICHLWGQQPFKSTKDKSKNNAVVGILALGEGWHNNHHFRPASARHGLLPGQFDLTYSVICLLERCKLVSDVQRYALCPECNDWHLAGADGKTALTKCSKSA